MSGVVRRDDEAQWEFQVERQTLAELIHTAEQARQRGATVLFRGLRVHSLHALLQLAAAGGRWHGQLSVG